MVALLEREVIFTDSLLKTLLLTQAGFHALPVGPELAEEDRALLERHKPGKAYLAGELPHLLRTLQRWEVPCFRLKAELPAAPARVLEDRIRFECGSRAYELRELAPGEADRAGTAHSHLRGPRQCRELRGH